MARSLGSLLLDWWPVGQGLFSTGTIFKKKDQPLTWVYDCGTTSSNKLLTNALNEHGKHHKTISPKSISVAALSHFDKDHISGFVKLVGTARIEHLLLPYIPLWQRLVIAKEQGIAVGDKLFAFFENPVSFLAQDGRAQIGEIVFVQGTGFEDPVPPHPELGEPPLGEFGEVSEIRIDYGDFPVGLELDPIGDPNLPIRVAFLKKAGRLVLPNVWEFVPYNDAQMAPRATPTFLTAAVRLIQDFRNAPATREKTLEKLKQTYDFHFGKSSRARNLISLFLYSGPLQRIRLRDVYTSSPIRRARLGWRYAQLNTGDGYLDDGIRFGALQRFYHYRLGRTGMFQVMHHGSRHNWHFGMGEFLKPAASIFCSDPAHKRFGHPHAEVLRDFWMYSPVQVDRINGFHLRGSLVAR